MFSFVLLGRSSKRWYNAFAQFVLRAMEVGFVLFLHKTTEKLFYMVVYIQRWKDGFAPFLLHKAVDGWS